MRYVGVYNVEFKCQICSSFNLRDQKNGHQKMANRALAAVSSLDSSLDSSLMRTKEWAKTWAAASFFLVGGVAGRVGACTGEDEWAATISHIDNAVPISAMTDKPLLGSDFIFFVGLALDDVFPLPFGRVVIFFRIVCWPFSLPTGVPWAVAPPVL